MSYISDLAEYEQHMDSFSTLREPIFFDKETGINQFDNNQ